MPLNQKVTTWSHKKMIEPLNYIELPHEDRKTPEKPQPEIHTDLLRRQM